MNKTFKQHYIKAMQILDDLNELISNISWSQSEDELDEDEYSLLDCLRIGVEDTEESLSITLYDSGLDDIYQESEED